MSNDFPTLDAISLVYRKELYNKLVHKRASRPRKKKKETHKKESKVQTVNMFANSKFPTIIVEIHHHSICGVQLDGGTAVSLMTDQVMGDLSLTNMETTDTILRVADQRSVKPLGILRDVQTMVASSEFYVTYPLVRLHSYGTSIFILMERPWLLQAQCVESWHKGTITIGPKHDHVQIHVVGKEILRETARTLLSDDGTISDIDESSNDSQPIPPNLALD